MKSEGFVWKKQLPSLKSKSSRSFSNTAPLIPFEQLNENDISSAERLMGYGWSTYTPHGGPR